MEAAKFGHIAIELALRRPDCVRRVILDGVPLFSDELRASLLAHYAPAMAPDDIGGQYQWAWHFIRDQSLYWPYFDRRPEARVNAPFPDADTLHQRTLDVLRALRTYHIAYRAAFRYDAAAALPQLHCPVLLMAAESDPLCLYLDEAARLLPSATVCRLPACSGVAERARAIRVFLA